MPVSRHSSRVSIFACIHMHTRGQPRIGPDATAENQTVLHFGLIGAQRESLSQNRDGSEKVRTFDKRTPLPQTVRSPTIRDSLVVTPRSTARCCRSMSSYGRVLAASWRVLAASWRVLATSWRMLAASRRMLAASRRMLAASWRVLAASWRVSSPPDRIRSIFFLVQTFVDFALSLPRHSL